MDIFLLYLFTRLNAVHGALFTILFFGGALMIAAVLAHVLINASCNPDSAYDKGALRFAQKMRPFAIWLPIAFVVLGTFKILLPTQKDLAIIVGGHFAVEAAQSDTAKKVYAIVQDALDEKIAEIATKKRTKAE